MKGNISLVNTSNTDSSFTDVHMRPAVIMQYIEYINLDIHCSACVILMKQNEWNTVYVILVLYMLAKLSISGIPDIGCDIKYQYGVSYSICSMGLRPDFPG